MSTNSRLEIGSGVCVPFTCGARACAPSVPAVRGSTNEITNEIESTPAIW
jgi:hypothetical protein